MSAQDYNFEVEKDILEVLREFLAGSGTTGSPLNYLVTTFSAVDIRFYLKESFHNVGVSVADTVVERFIYQFPPVAITPMEMFSCGGDGSLVLHVPEHIIALPALPYYKVRSISVEGDMEKLLVLDNAWAPVFAKCKMVRRCGVTLERCVLTRPFVEVLRGAFPTGDFSLSLTMITTLVALPALAQICLHRVLL